MKLQFHFRFDRPFFWPAAGLTPETYINNQRACCLEGTSFSERSLGKSLYFVTLSEQNILSDVILIEKMS